MTINTSVTNGHQTEMYGHTFPMSLWKSILVGLNLINTHEFNAFFSL